MILLSFLFITLYGQALHSTYNVFLTQGETYSLPMIELFKEQILNFTIENQPNNVELFKTLSILSEQNNNQLFISLSSTFLYFLLINKVDVLNIYNWNSTDINLINQVDLPQQTCLNALLISENSIIIDCYNLTNLNIYIYQEPFWTIIYSRLIQQIPKTTDLQLFTSNSINSILYAQYYQNYEILTQFQFNQSILYNMSIWMQPFNNFIVSNKLQSQNTIYIWNSSTLYLLNVTQSGLNQIYQYYDIGQIITVQIFNPQLLFYECDTLLIISMYYTYKNMICNQTISFQSVYSPTTFAFYNLPHVSINFNYTNQVFLSNQFLIFQLFDLIQIYEIIDLNFNLIGGLKLNSSFTKVSFDYNSNQLFIFSDTQIQTYQVNYPQIKFNSEQNQSNYQFIIIGSQYEINYTEGYECQNCTIQLDVSVLLTNDNETYLINENTSNQTRYIFESQNYPYLIQQFSGSLLTANFQVENSSLGNFEDITFSIVGFINQSFQNFQFLDMNFAVGIINQQFFLLERVIDYNDQYNLYTLYSETINQQITIMNNQIEGYVIGFYIFFGIQINKSQLLLCIECDNYRNQTNILTFQPFQQFYLLFNQIVLLLETNIIQICSFTGNCTNLQINNSSIVPVGIVLNQQSYSSILFINNNYSSIIIGQITQQNTYIIQSIINVQIKVQDMKIVNNRLILCYNCQNTQFICFQVWNVQNLNFPFFEKNLRNIQNTNNIQYFADNLFYYVQTNNQIYVYNPVMLEHSSLFYTFNYTGSYFATTSQDVALISFNYQFYVLLPVLTYSYHTTLNNTISNEISFWSNSYNVSVSSQIGTQNIIQYPSNQQIIILNDFLNIQLNNQSYNVSESHVILTKDNITSSGQIGWFNISCKSKSQITNILNEIKLTNFNCDQLMTVFNQTILCFQELYYYNNTYNYNLYIQNINPEGKLINQSNTINMTNITNYHDNISFSMNAQYIFFVSQNQDSQGQFVNDLLRINITNQQQLSNMTNLTRLNISNVNNLILQDDILYIYSDQLIIIYYTSLNITQSIQTLCYMIDFQPFVFQKSNYSFYGLTYACQDNEHLYYLLGKQQQQENNTIQFISRKHLQIQNYYYFDSSIKGFLIVSQQINQIAIMCFTSQFSIIIKLDYLVNETNFVNSILQFNRVLKLSPPFTTNSQYQYVDAAISSGLVFVTYFNNSIYDQQLFFYNISGLHTNFRNLDYTILPSGTLQLYFQQPLNILTFNSSYGFLLGYPNYKISSLKIDIYLQNTTDQCNLTASNLMNTLNANYTFNFKSQIDFGFEYALLAVLIIFFIAATTLFWYRTRDQKEQFGLEEFEGFEIDTFQ